MINIGKITFSDKAWIESIPSDFETTVLRVANLPSQRSPQKALKRIKYEASKPTAGETKLYTFLHLRSQLFPRKKAKRHKRF